MPKKKAPQTERLQKAMAHAGVASRRASEALISAGRVRVNGQVVTELGTKVNPLRDKITVDGKAIDGSAEEMVYIILNKPANVLSAANDDRGRRTVLDLVQVDTRIYPVGRLDLQSEGLILLTNDGNLTKALTHPSSHIEKEYEVLVTGKPSTDTLMYWRSGKVKLEGESLSPAVVEKTKGAGDNTWLRIILTEGRKRQIREVARLLGHPVIKLERIRIGPIRLGNLKSGHWRHLNAKEIQRLKQAMPKQRSNP